jgi:hypothetical protein
LLLFFEIEGFNEWMRGFAADDEDWTEPFSTICYPMLSSATRELLPHTPDHNDSTMAVGIFTLTFYCGEIQSKICCRLDPMEWLLYLTMDATKRFPTRSMALTPYFSDPETNTQYKVRLYADNIAIERVGNVFDP